MSKPNRVNFKVLIITLAISFALIITGIGIRIVNSIGPLHNEFGPYSVYSDDTWETSNVAKGEVYTFKFTPQESNFYYIYGYGLYLIDIEYSNGYSVSLNDLNQGTSSFFCSVNLQKNQTYIITTESKLTEIQLTIE